MPSQAECAVSTLQSFDGSRLELGMKLFKGGLMSRPPHMNAVHEHVADLDTPVTMTWSLVHTQQAFAKPYETSVPNKIFRPMCQPPCRYHLCSSRANGTLGKEMTMKASCSASAGSSTSINVTE